MPLHYSSTEENGGFSIITRKKIGSGNKSYSKERTFKKVPSPARL